MFQFSPDKMEYMDKNVIDIESEKHTSFAGVIGCYNAILARGVAGMLKGDPRLHLMGVFSQCDGFMDAFSGNDLDFCLVDSYFLKCLAIETREKNRSKCKVLLIENIPISSQELHSLVTSLNISGMVYRDTDEKNLKKAIFKVLAGEFWFKRGTFEVLFRRSQDAMEAKAYFMELLTPAEIKVARLVCQGLKNREIARHLFISENTVKAHLYKIYQKFKIKSRTELMKLCMKEL